MPRNLTTYVRARGTKLTPQILKELSIHQKLSTVVLHRILTTFFNHIMRREEGMERLIVQGKIEGRRYRGRLPTRWANQILHFTNKNNFMNLLKKHTIETYGVNEYNFVN